jgi:L-alanine-DL-glutamate epimerase-like enolase superfamily enzyme
MKIADIVLIEATGEFPPDPPSDGEHMSVPLDIYPEFLRSDVASPRKADALVRHTDVYLEVRTDEGVTGLFGPVDGGHAIILRREFRDFLIGRDPLAVEKIWDLLLRRNRHARAGHYMMAMSALDCALWDLKGKALAQPVYRLLGGPTQGPVSAYASMLGFSLDLEPLAECALERKRLGYRAQKWFFRHGPARGPEGAAKNVEVARALRQAVGDDVSLMFDAFNSWDVPYAVDVGTRIAPYRPAWLEEPVPVDRLDGLRTIRERTGIPIATGEHLYTRWQVKQVLDAQAADVIQADPDWCGGISELVKIATLCSAYDVPVCPHGHSLHAALHVAAALPQNVLPMVEFLVLHQRHKQRFMKGFLEPRDGVIRPPETPGLGIEIDPAKVQSQRAIE